LAVAFLCLAIAGPAGGQAKQDKDKGKGGKDKDKAQEAKAPKEEKINFVPGTDISSWYWTKQVDEEVTTPDDVPIPPQVPPLSQRARLPNPQRPDTIPVQLNQGAIEKMAAIKFDLLERGVVEGSTIEKMVMFIQESPDRNEQPQVSPDTAKIQACRTLDFVPQGENETFDDAPKYEESECAPGTRELIQGAPVATWTFDLTKIAEAWAKDPYDNNGVMLVPVVEAGRSWQVNLKVPRKEAPAEEGDQYELTKERAFISIKYVPGDPLELPELEVPEVPETTDATTPSTGGTTTVPSVGTTSTSPIISPSTDITGGSSGIPGSSPVAPAPAPTEIAGFGIPQEQGPRMPSYVWLAIPLGLLALSAVRSVILEPVGGPRPDGVISAIRRRNAERRGGALVGQRRGALAGVTSKLKRGTGGVGKALSGATKIVRRKR
jgi:hypothetical protein